MYRKPTFTELYTRSTKLVLDDITLIFIKTLVHRALLICSTNKLEQELELIKKIFCDSRYPVNVVQATINAKVTQFHKSKDFNRKKCCVMFSSRSMLKYIHKNELPNNPVFHQFKCQCEPGYIGKTKHI